VIYEVHRKVDNNVGDYYSNPSRYFNFDNIKSQELMHNSTDLAAQNLIIGGGGLIHKKFQLHIQNLLDKNPQNSVLWGIGHNFGKKHIEKSKNKVIFPDWLAIEFIGSHDTIITDSYHGAYWAMLLNKQVQVVSWSIKFNYFKNSPLFLDNINQKPLSQTHFVQKNYLQECRDLNKNFYHKVLDLFS